VAGFRVHGEIAIEARPVQYGRPIRWGAITKGRGTVSQAIARHLTPEEREYQRYLVEIEIRRGRLAQLQADLAAYKEELGRFNAEYHARVGVLFVELDRIELQIKEYEFRIAQLKQNPDIDPHDLEQQTKQQFTEEREQIHDEEEETRFYEQAHREEQKRPELDEESEASLRDLYREMVKRFHPDLAKTEDERLQREETMKEVNAAFHERDIHRLRTIATQRDVDDQAFEAKSIGEKLVWAIREVSRLDERIQALLVERQALEESEIGSLWDEYQKDSQVLGRLELSLNEKIRVAKTRRQALLASFRALTEEEYLA
jgi:hypothetical protein